MDDLIERCHKYSCEKNNWDYSKIEKRSYVYDNYYHSIKKGLRYLKNGSSNLEELSSEIHKGWIENYKFWCMKPYLIDNRFIDPLEEIECEKRKKLLVDYKLLEEDEKEKDRVIGRFLLENKGLL